MDAVTAFLNGILEEEIYIEQPEGYVIEGQEGKVLKLNKSLYGLKQSPKIWQDDVQEYLVSIGFVQCEINHCTYIRTDNNRQKFTAVYVHVDDMAITGNDALKFKKEISNKWEMEDLGLAQVVVGIEISRINEHSYSMTQRRFAETVLERFSMTNAKPASTPLTPNLKLYRASDEEVQSFALLKLNYRSAVGSLMYSSQFTRPDLAHAVGVLSQHLERPALPHWNTAVQVFRYLKGTVNLGITYNGNSTKVVSGQKSFNLPTSHCDADWAGDKSTRRSTTGYIFTLAGGALSWKSRLQPTVALSSTEAEYRAVTEAGQELLWLRRIMEAFGCTDENATILQSDNLGAIHLTSKSTFHGRTKNIEIHYHWIREVVKNGYIKLQHCPTEEMVADLLTKALGKQQFLNLRNKLGLN